MTCRGKPAQVATSICDVVNVFAEKNIGYAPFFFAKHQGSWDPARAPRLDEVALKVADIGVFPSDPPSATDQLRLPNLHMGWIDLIAIGQEKTGADLCRLVFTCQEQEWLRFEGPWNQLVDGLRELGILIGRSAKTWKHSSGHVSVPSGLKASATPKKRGPKPILDDDWAFDQIYVKKRDWNTVYQEWLKKIPRTRRNRLSEEENAFFKAMKRRYKKWEGRNVES